MVYKYSFSSQFILCNIPKPSIEQEACDTAMRTSVICAAVLSRPFLEAILNALPQLESLQHP